MTVTIYRRQGEPIEPLIKRFNTAVSKHGVLKNLKNKQFYLKPSEKIRKKIKDSKFERNKGTHVGFKKKERV
jgi:ribosomal protein S21